MIQNAPNFSPETTVFDFWQFSYRPLRQGGSSERTLEDYRSQLRIFERIFQKIRSVGDAPRLQDLSDELLAEVMAHRVQEGRSKATANGLHKVICPIWRHATIRKKILTTLPCVDLYPVPKRVRSVPTPTEFEAILEACLRADYMVGKIPARVFWPALIALDVNLGVRINSLMSIRKEDCHLEGRRVLVRGEKQKHRADQWFTLLPRTVAFLRPLWAWNTEVLLPWPYDPKPYQWQTLRRHFRRILEANGLPCDSERMFHCFRRYCGTRVTKAMGIERAREFLGHSSVAITRGYVDPLQGTETQAAELAFPELMGDGEPPPAPTPPPVPTPGGPRLRVFSGDLVAG